MSEPTSMGPRREQDAPTVRAAYDARRRDERASYAAVDAARNGDPTLLAALLGAEVSHERGRVSIHGAPTSALDPAFPRGTAGEVTRTVLALPWTGEDAARAHMRRLWSDLAGRSRS